MLILGLLKKFHLYVLFVCVERLRGDKDKESATIEDWKSKKSCKKGKIW